MVEQAIVSTQRRRGPKPTGKGVMVGVRFQPIELAALDAWIAQQPNPVSRPEAIRAMVQASLVLMGED